MITTQLPGSLSKRLRLPIETFQRLHLSTVEVVNKNRINAEYQKNRTDYKNELHLLRKSWQKEIKQRVEVALDEQRAIKKQVILETAVRRREKKKISLIRQEKDKQMKQEARVLYQEKLARSLLMKEEKLAQQAIRHKNLLADLEAEEPAWINSSNIDEKITEALFEKKFSSTGLAIPESKNWRYQALTFHWNREYSKDVEEMIADHVAKGNAGFIASQEDLSKRLMVEQLLRPMISTGKNRSEYGSLVDDFVNTISKVGGISDQKIIDPTTFMVREGKVVPAEERLEETPGDEGEFEPRPSSDELRQWFHEDFGSEMATDVPESQKGDQRKKQQQQQQAGKGKAKGKGKK